MSIQQLSVFIENKPGRLAAACAVLADAGVNIHALSLADTEKFGILRLIVADWERGQRLLQDAGYMVKCTAVLAVLLPNTPGSLSQLLEALRPINIDYLYAMSDPGRAQSVMFLRVDALEKAETLCRQAGIPLLESF